MLIVHEIHFKPIMLNSRVASRVARNAVEYLNVIFRLRSGQASSERKREREIFKRQHF